MSMAFFISSPFIIIRACGIVPLKVVVSSPSSVPKATMNCFSQSAFELLLLFVAGRELVGLGGDQQRFVQLFGPHLPQIEVGELRRFAQQRIVALVPAA